MDKGQMDKSIAQGKARLTSSTYGWSIKKLRHQTTPLGSKNVAAAACQRDGQDDEPRIHDAASRAKLGDFGGTGV
ncbi:hypothetical protein E4U44_002842 [Claviceps purpurea]|nr:hypothetical protein E4U44_002842 [Claviceps purpurea]